MQNGRARWLGALGVVVLLGAVVVAGGPGMTRADDELADNNDRGKNPFTLILKKLNQILAALKSGGQEGNHTLRWDTNNPSASRFVTAFPGAVLDKNTGLVWEQAPAQGGRLWTEATSYCINKTVGGTVGWRLPSVVELKSVQDRSLPPPFVPTNVFTGVEAFEHWSATTDATFPTAAWVVIFGLGGPDASMGKDLGFGVWCVRGPMQESVY